MKRASGCFAGGIFIVLSARQALSYQAVLHIAASISVYFGCYAE
jgi:hypothetical protein